MYQVSSVLHIIILLPAQNIRLPVPRRTVTVIDSGFTHGPDC
jgi:hypothetical protein